MLYSILEESAAKYPDRVAMTTAGLNVTYRDLQCAADHLALRLAGSGLAKDDVAALRIPNSAEFAAALFAVSRCGAAAVLIDPVLKPEEAKEYARRAGARMILESGVGAPAAVEGAEIPTFAIPEIASLNCLEEKAGPVVVLGGEDTAVMLLSSGTSGDAKIVPKTASQARAALEVFERTVPYREDDRILAALPFNHSFGFFNVFLAGIAAGATLVVEKYSPRQTANAIAEEKVSILPATPFMFRMMALTEFDTAPDFSAVRVAVSAGAALPPAVLDKFHAKFGVPIWQSYGTTESGPAALNRTPADADMPKGCVGTPYAKVTIRIQDEDGVPLSDGTEGEVAIRSGACTSGYLGELEEKSTCFRDGWVLTGDVGRLDPESGALVICGRRKRMINVAGKKVSPDEVEACLLTHPGVKDALVTGDPADTGEERVLAYVVTAGETEVVDIRNHCARHLADFKVPRVIELVYELKRGPMGKVPHRMRPQSLPSGRTI